MEIQYRRNFSESYMIVESPEGTALYEEQMVRKNEIPALLPFRRMEVNGKIQLWYDITGMDSLRERMRRQGVDMEGLKHMVECLDAACSEMQKYLLRQEHIYLSPDTIFFADDGQICLCYCPAAPGDPFDEMREVMEFILTLVEEDQEETAELCYRLYDITLQEHYHFPQMLKCMENFSGEIPEDEERGCESGKRDPAEKFLEDGSERRDGAEEDLGERPESGAGPERTDFPDPFGGEYLEIPLMEEPKSGIDKRENLMRVVRRARVEIMSLRKVAAQMIAGENLSFSDRASEDFAPDGDGIGRKKGAGD